MKHQSNFTPDLQAAYDIDLKALDAAKDCWARTSLDDRIAVLQAVKDNLMRVADEWVDAAGKAKGIPQGSPLLGEEWTSGPYAVMSCCNGLIDTLSQMEGKTFLDGLKKRSLPSGQTAVRVVPHSIWDRLLISGVHADVWMQKGVTPANLKNNAASAYDIPADQRRGKVALVLGAGNIAAITPLDAFQKLFLENQVVLLKMNPVNDYLTEPLQAALKPLIDRDALRIHRGDGPAGAYLTTHPLVEEIHITGARATHDLIVWGPGEEGEKNKAANTPKNTRHMTSELGAVCPTIVVPGPWTKADLRFQAENIATMKLHNGGFNCVAVQSLILPKGWDKTAELMGNVADVMAKHTKRAAYYPGAEDRQKAFVDHAKSPQKLDRGADVAPLYLADMAEGDSDWLTQTEVFTSALGVMHIEAQNAETYLIEAIKWANDTLYGTLGGNIIIHPATIRAMGRKRFEEIIAEFRYGAIAINAWSGLAFLVTACPWGGFAGATLQNVQSGVGTVHNTFMLENVERTVIEAPFRPFPRNLLSGGMSLLPRPPWFVSNKRQHHIGRLLTRFQHKPSWFKLPRIFFHALLG
jgi:acyl-CoA reductase-like NAD-dependent aldehyde dehydrogenase